MRVRTQGCWTPELKEIWQELEKTYLVKMLRKWKSTSATSTLLWMTGARLFHRAGTAMTEETSVGFLWMK